MLTLAVALVLAYLIGSIPIGVLVGRAQGFDPRAVGSGNIGMTNVARAGGRAAAAVTFVGDLLKGLLPVLAAKLVGLPQDQLVAVGLSAFLGAVYSVFLRFKGGRGVSSSLGVWLALGPAAILVALGLFVLVLAVGRIVSLASISGAIALPIAVAAMGYPPSFLALALIMAAIVLWRHRANIQRLRRGQEPAFGAGRRRQAQTPPAA